MSEIVDITVGVIQEEITISAVNNIGEITVNAVSNSEEVNITANTNLIQININTAPISIINPQDYDLSQFTNTSSNPFVQQSALLTYVPIYRTIKINGVQQDLSADREWNFPVAVWGSISGTLSAQTDLQAALNAKQNTLTLTTTGSSGVATLVGATLNIPNYTISGLGGVPSSRTLTINGTSYDLSADRSWTISTGITIGTTAITSGVVGRVLFEGVGNVVQESADLFWDNINGRLGLGTSSPTARLQVNGTITIQNGSSRGLVFTPWTSGANIDPVTASNNLYFGRDVAFSNVVFQSGNVLINTTVDAGYKLDVNGTLRVSGDTSIVGSILQTSASFTGTHTIAIIGNNTVRFTNSGIGHYMVAGPTNVVDFLGQRLYATQRGAIFGNTTWASSIVGLSTLVPQSSGTNSTAGIEINYAINNTGTYSGTTRGIYYNPTLTSLTGTTHVAIETVSGNVIFGSSSGNVGIGTSNPNAKLDIQQNIDGNGLVIVANTSAGTSARNAISLGNNTGNIASIDLYGSNYNIGSTDDVANGLRILNSGTGGIAFRASNASGSIRSYIGSAEVMRIASNGNVGIGTNNPTNTLQVNGTFNSLALWTNLSGITSWGNSGSVAFGGLTWGTGYAMVYSTPGNTLNFGTNGSTTRMTISTAGNVSIGDSVFPSASWTNALTIGPNSTNKIITGYLASSTNGAVIGAHNSALNAWADLNIVADAIIFRRLGEVEAMRIANTGNVLIGTNTDAGFKLDVNGTSRFSGLTNFNANVVLNSNWLYIGPNGGNTLLRPVSTTNLQLFNNNAGATLFLNANGSVQLGSSNVVNWATFSASGHTIYGTTNTNFFSSGNVGINTATDAGYKFDVNGTMRVTDTTILGSTNQILTFTPTATLPLLEQNGSVGSRIRTTSGTRLLQLENYSGDANYLSASGAGLWIRTTDSNPVYFRTNNTTAGQISANQNWTIGGTIDAGYKLDVIGTARVSTSVESLEFRTDAGGSNFYRTAEIFMQSAIATGLITTIAQRALIVQNVNNGTNRDGTLFSVGPVSSLSVPQQNMYFNRLLGTLQLYNGGAQNFDSTANLVSSILSLESTTKGFLPPRMTTTEKNAIATPATGLVVYDTTLNALSSFNGTVWSTIGGSVAWGSITGTLSSQTDLQTALNGKFNNPTGSSADYLDGTGAPVPFPTFASADKMVTIGRNATGSTLYKGTIVYISGSTGNRPNYVKAQANAESTSAGTFGVILSDIPNNTDGNAVTIGTVDNLDTRSTAPNPFTTDTLVDGDTIYLSPTTPGYVTRIKPSAPNHLVYIGKVVRTSPTNGTIVYRIQNGYELDEIHDVAISAVANNDILQYELSTDLWKNKSLAAAGIQPTITPEALTKVDDTNVTLTLGGSPSTALLQAISLTLGWTGTLADSRIASAAAWNAKQNAITLTTTGTSGPATLVGSTLNIPQYGGGGGASIIKLTAQTLAVGSWTLVGSYYQYTFSNASITTNTRVDFTPDNASYNEVTTCGMLPQVDETTGSCTFYSLFPPQSNITGEILIIPTI